MVSGMDASGGVGKDDPLTPRRANSRIPKVTCAAE